MKESVLLIWQRFCSDLLSQPRFKASLGNVFPRDLKAKPVRQQVVQEGPDPHRRGGAVSARRLARANHQGARDFTLCFINCAVDSTGIVAAGNVKVLSDCV